MRAGLLQESIEIWEPEIVVRVPGKAICPCR